MFIWKFIYHCCLYWSWKSPMGSGQLGIHTYIHKSPKDQSLGTYCLAQPTYSASHWSHANLIFDGKGYSDRVDIIGFILPLLSRKSFETRLIFPFFFSLNWFKYTIQSILRGKVEKINIACKNMTWRSHWKEEKSFENSHKAVTIVPIFIV